MMRRGSLRSWALFVSIAPFVVLLLGPSLPQVKSFFPSHVRQSTKLPILESGAHHLVTRASRRTFFEYLKVAAISAAGVAATAAPTCAKAASPLDAGEAIRRSAANIPGYGQTDVFFPVNLMGTWSMNRQVDFGNGRDPLQLSYPFRFIRSIEDDAVVADRGFNQAELEKAIVRAVTGNDDTSSSGVRSYEWVQTNPNDLRLVLMDGKRKEIKVTKRATEKTDTTVSSSEFQRITQEDSRGVPNISARRVVSKWKIVDGKTLEGLEMIYDMGGGDPLAASSGTNSKPTVLSKSRILLTR